MGGNFNNAGSIQNKNIALWDTIEGWGLAGGGITYNDGSNAIVYALAFDSTTIHNLFIGGKFDRAKQNVANNISSIGGINAWYVKNTDGARLALNPLQTDQTTWTFWWDPPNRIYTTGSTFAGLPLEG